MKIDLKEIREFLIQERNTFTSLREETNLDDNREFYDGVCSGLKIAEDFIVGELKYMTQK